MAACKQSIKVYVSCCSCESYLTLITLSTIPVAVAKALEPTLDTHSPTEDM